MAYELYDKPGEFFNLAPTTTALAVGTGTITLGTASNTSSTAKFLTNLTDTQAALAGEGSTAQVVFGITDALYQRFNSINTANQPANFRINRTAVLMEPGELVYTYTTTIRVAPTGLVAANS